MKFYIYNVDNKKIVAIIDGHTNKECETKADKYLGIDKYAGTYSPAFGFVGGLIDNPDAEIL